MGLYIKIDGIEGESKDAQHKGWIDAISSGYSVSQSVSVASGGGGGVGKADFAAFSFTHRVDRSSPNLFMYCAAGKHIPKVDVSVCKSGGKHEEYLHVTLSDATISCVDPNGMADSEWTEVVSIAYSKIVIDYKEQNADGTLGATVSGGWNVKENKKV